jgi:hypothetical protein
MMAEAFKMLQPYGPLRDYKYIGLGGLEFIDFKIFFKKLEIRNLVSIEKDTNSQSRFEFNKPFNAIDIKFNYTWDVIKDIDWDKKCIVWLDYPYQIRKGIVKDIRYFVQNAPVGSFLAITLNAESEYVESPSERSRREMDELKDTFDAGLVPNYGEKDNFEFRGWGKSNVYRDIITRQIDRMIEEYRNNIRMSQIFNFRYRGGGPKRGKGARMMTVGWLLSDDSPPSERATSNLQALSFTRTDDEYYLIKVPTLTNKERIKLEEYVPYKGGSTPNWIDGDEFQEFVQTHRYYNTLAPIVQV